MDYARLAEEFLDEINAFRRFKPQKCINESMRGEAFVLHHISTSGEPVIPSEISDAMGIVMKDGDIIESGSHTELLDKNGFCAELYNSQFEGPGSGE